MAKKQSTKQRTRVKDMPRKERKLNAEDLKKVKGGEGPEESITFVYQKFGNTTKPPLKTN